MAKKKLVIDDDPALLDMMREVLVYDGYEVACLDSTKGVLREIESNSPDLVVIDYLLNCETNGGEICHQIKSNPFTSNIPVVIISAFEKVFLSLGDYNCDFFMPKPLEINELFFSFKKLTSSQMLRPSDITQV